MRKKEVDLDDLLDMVDNWPTPQKDNIQNIVNKAKEKSQ